MKHYLLILLTVLLLILTSCVTQQNHDDQPTPTEPILPNENPYVDETKFYNSFGFSSLVVTNRDNAMYDVVEVNDEIAFLDSLMDKNIKVIKISQDLSMGSLEVEQQLLLKNKSLSDYQDVFRPHSRQPLMHPTLLETGVSQIRIINRSDLMIYSDSGIKIKHASFIIDNSENLVFRNLHLTELWEWDEYSRGQYKRNDWDYFTVEKSSGIWFDHLTFDNVYDGVIDVKEYTSNLTLSWSKLNFTPNAFVDEQIDYLEENMDKGPYYKELRDQGIPKEDLKIFASFQKKGFNLGNTTDGVGFESITMTFHHLEVYNLMDRMPRLRKGDVHLYHVIVDNEMLYDFRIEYPSSDLSYVNQSLVSTEGGAILMEHAILKYVTSPIKNHQDDRDDIVYTGSYKVINSELVLKNRTYFGSSDDPFTLWVHTGEHEKIPFGFRNHLNIPYRYTLEDIYYLPETFNNYPTGAQNKLNFNWLYFNE